MYLPVELILTIPITISIYLNRGLVSSLPSPVTANIILILASAILIQPAGEEVIFRYLLKDMGVYSTILFGLAHLSPVAVTGNWNLILFNVFATTILGYFCMEQPTLSRSIVLHCAYNFLTMGTAIFLDLITKPLAFTDKTGRETRYIKVIKRRRSKSIENIASGGAKEFLYEFVSEKDFYPPIKGLDYDKPFKQNLPGLLESISK